MEQEIVDTLADQPNVTTRDVGYILGEPQSTTWQVLKGERLDPYPLPNVLSTGCS